MTPSESLRSPAVTSMVVEVTDTGIGMDQDALNKIFEPYFSTKATGTGLGLTIAKRNIELNGGTIAVASQRGVGTTVTMTLPIASAYEYKYAAPARSPSYSTSVLRTAISRRQKTPAARYRACRPTGA